MAQFEHISVAEVAEKLADLAVVDIRDPNSFHAGHIEGAFHLNNDTVAEFMSQTPKDKPVAVVCYHGVSSQQAAQFLVEQGYEAVFSMDGGFEAWKQSMPISQD